jgi:hypothetical protein
VELTKVENEGGDGLRMTCSSELQRRSSYVQWRREMSKLELEREREEVRQLHKHDAKLSGMLMETMKWRNWAKWAEKRDGERIPFSFYFKATFKSFLEAI